MGDKCGNHWVAILAYMFGGMVIGGLLLVSPHSWWGGVKEWQTLIGALIATAAAIYGSQLVWRATREQIAAAEAAANKTKFEQAFGLLDRLSYWLEINHFRGREPIDKLDQRHIEELESMMREASLRVGPNLKSAVTLYARTVQRLNIGGDGAPKNRQDLRQMADYFSAQLHTHCVKCIKEKITQDLPSLQRDYFEREARQKLFGGAS